MQLERRHLNEEMIEKIAKSAATAAVHEVLVQIGLDPNDKKTGKDIENLRALIKAWETTKNVAFIEFIKWTVKLIMWGILAIGIFKIGSSSGFIKVP